MPSLPPPSLHFTKHGPAKPNSLGPRLRSGLSRNQLCSFCARPRPQGAGAVQLMMANPWARQCGFLACSQLTALCLLCLLLGCRKQQAFTTVLCWQVLSPGLRQRLPHLQLSRTFLARACQRSCHCLCRPLICQLLTCSEEGFPMTLPASCCHTQKKFSMQRVTQFASTEIKPA